MIETNDSLLDRLKLEDDHDAWREFFHIYWSPIIRYSRKMGLNEHESEDAVLYITRNGSTRTGAYAVATSPTSDGFMPDPARAAGTTAILSRYHSADYNHDGIISPSELLRMIVLYNYRNGATRTGQYHVAPTGVDGFAPGP